MDSTSSSTPIVQVKTVRRLYGKGELQVAALDGVSLDIEAGEFLAIAGPSGSGKSTLLNMIGALDSPTEGDVLVEGKSLGALSAGGRSRLRRERLGFVFQSYNLQPVLTAYENAEYVMLLQGSSKNARQTRVMEVLHSVGLEGLTSRYPHQLSGGQQQRVAIARAIAPRPAIVLADEPTANLDSKTAASLMELMLKLNQEHGITFLFSSHDETVLERARRVVHLKDGKIEKDVSA